MADEEGVFALLLAFVHGANVVCERRLGADGRTRAQFRALRSIGASPGQTQQQLAEALGVTKGNVSQLVTRLVADGLVRRRPVGATSEVHLTEQGSSWLRSRRPEQERILSDLFGSLTPEELECLESMLQRLRENLATHP